MKAARSTSDRVRAEAFSIADCIRRAEDTFEFPPAKSHIVRPEPQGQMMAVFVLPLELVQPQNRTRHAQPWKLKKLKKDCYDYMLGQVYTANTRFYNGARPTLGFMDRSVWPLRGRPQVLCTRFTSAARIDAFNDGFKFAVDKLCTGDERLGILVDDCEAAIDLRQWNEPARPRMGFGLIRVFSGRVPVI